MRQYEHSKSKSSRLISSNESLIPPLPSQFSLDRTPATLALRFLNCCPSENHPRTYPLAPPRQFLLIRYLQFLLIRYLFPKLITLTCIRWYQSPLGRPQQPTTGAKHPQTLFTFLLGILFIHIYHVLFPYISSFGYFVGIERPAGVHQVIRIIIITAMLC